MKKFYAIFIATCQCERNTVVNQKNHQTDVLIKLYPSNKLGQLDLKLILVLLSLGFNLMSP